METPLPAGFEWCLYDVDTKNEEELIQTLNEVTEFIQKQYKIMSQNFLEIKNYLKWMLSSKCD